MNPIVATPPVVSAARPQASPPESAQQRARIALLGATGYSGQEFARLALGHPGLELAVLCSREHAGRPVSSVIPGLDPRATLLPQFASLDSLEPMLDEGGFDTLVTCLPHGVWRELAKAHPRLATEPRWIVDLSGDHRDGAADYRYGLPEAFRAELTGASRIANPGCYPTAATLALLPALEAGWLAGPLSVSALSGVSGAGRAPLLRTSFVELEGGAAVYKAGEVHVHVPEMERAMTRVHGTAIDVAFVPQLAPMARGILLTASAPLDRVVTPEEAHAAYARRYANEAFVQLLEPGTWPETRHVRTSNRCDVSVTTVHGGRTLLATAALDNLVKGAAGQAVQNLNLMLGWPEVWGLPVHGSPW